MKRTSGYGPQRTAALDAPVALPVRDRTLQLDLQPEDAVSPTFRRAAPSVIEPPAAAPAFSRGEAAPAGRIQDGRGPPLPEAAARPDEGPQAATSYSLSSATSVTEGGQITFTITRSGDKPAETLYFSTLSDGTATWGEGDYATTSGGKPENIAVSFSAGTTSRTITLNILNDGQADAGEQFRAIVQRDDDDPASTYLARSSYVTINEPVQNTTYSLSPSVTTVTEGGQVTFTITRSGDRPAETIYFSTLSSGSATYDEGDYATTSGGRPENIAVSFSAGASSRTVTLNILNDGAADSGEQFRAIIQRDDDDPTSTYLDRSAYVTINDPAPSTTYSLNASAPSITEGGQVTFTITRSGDTPAETVYFSTLADGSATYDEGDYATTSGGRPENIAVSFSVGSTSRTITLNVLNDGQADAGEQFRAIVQRDDDDPASTYLARSGYVAIAEAVQNTAYALAPAAGVATEGGQVVFTVTRSGDTPAETIYFSTLAEGSASYDAGDYATASGGRPENVAVTFAAGSTTGTVTLNILNDGVADSGEQFRAVVQRDDDDPASTYLSRSSFVTINDAAQSAGYTLTPSTTTAVEGGQVVFTITRTNTAAAERVYFSTLSDGTATWGEGDYVTTTGGRPADIVVDFAAGSGVRTVTLDIRDDGASDSGERFRAIIQHDDGDPVSTYLGRSAYVTINDPAVGTSYALNPSSFTVVESGVLTFSVTRSGTLSAETVFFSTLTDGTASYAEGDYTTLDGGRPADIAVNFAAGVTTQTVSLRIREDGQADTGETFRAVLQRHVDDPLALSLDQSASIRIEDARYVEDDADPEIDIWSFFVNVAHAEEGGGFEGLRTPFGDDAHPAGDWSPSQDLGQRYVNPDTGQIAFHLGEDWNLAQGQDHGQDVYAIYDGEVVHAGSHVSFGNVVVLEHVIDGQTYYSLYAHLSSIEGFSGSPPMVHKGQKIGDLGDTGQTDNSHLHFELFSVSGSASVESYLASGTPQHHRFGYTWNPAIETTAQNGVTNRASYTEGGFTWFNPSMFIAEHGPVLTGRQDQRDAAFLQLQDLEDTLTDITQRAGDVLVSAGDATREILLRYFEELHVLGGRAADYLRISSLLGTTIDQHTVYFDGGMGEDQLDAGEADRRIVAEGGAGDDILSTGSGDDSLSGGEGRDVLNGGTGVDTADYATAAAGVTASLTTGQATNDGDGGTDAFAGIENLTGSAFADSLTGNGGNNALTGGGGNDQLSGLNGDDVLIGGAGVDVLAGGGGIDTADYSGAAAGMRAQLNANASSNDGDGGTDTFSSIENLTGSAFNDTLIGDGMANVLRGGLGADTLLGLGGNDVLWGGSGALNTLQGGLGDDRYVLEAADSIVENLGEGIDTVEARIAVYTLATNVENLVFGGTGAFTGTGNALANTLTGGAGDDNLRGRGGADVLNGGLGADTVDYTLAAAGVVARLDLMRATNDGDGATDTFTGVENLTGSNFNDLLIGDAGNNVLMGGIGTDTLLGFGGNDVLWGGSGGGNNQLQGGQGDDWYILDAFDTCVEVAGEGIDTVEARIGSYTLGNNIENLLYTGPGKFVGSGNALNNTLTGGAQNDILKGGGGNDVINGGLGSDEVQFRGSKAQYTVAVEGSAYRIVDSVAGRDGSTLVSSIEVLRFLTGNTTTALTYAASATSGEGKAPQPLVSPIIDDQPVVLPALHDKAFDDTPLVLPGPEADKMLLRELFVLDHGGSIGAPHGLTARPDWIPDAVAPSDWM